jgi:hypothetical protein
LLSTSSGANLPGLPQTVSFTAPNHKKHAHK